MLDIGGKLLASSIIFIKEFFLKKNYSSKVAQTPNDHILVARTFKG